MTVTRIQMIDWEGSESLDDVKYAVRFLVTTNDRNDGPLTVRSALGITYGTPYASGNESDSRAVALDIKEQRVAPGDYNHWHVDVNYGNPTNQTSDNPLLDPVEEVWSWEGQERPVFRDASGLAIFNTAGDFMPYESTGTDNLPKLTYRINLALFSSSIAQAARNAVNDSAWKGFSTGVVKVDSITAATLYHKSVGQYFATDFTFGVNPDTWQEPVPSLGWREKKTIGGVTKLVRGRDQQQPWLLDSAGKFLISPSDVPATVVVEKYPELNFNTIFPFL